MRLDIPSQTMVRKLKPLLKDVTRWRDADMVERWVASAWLLTEKHFHKIDGHKDLWALSTILGRPSQASASKEKVA